MDMKIEQEKAMDDIKYIKEIIKKTSLSMEAFYHIFIIWGILFSVISVIFIIGIFIPVPSMRIDIISSEPIINKLNIIQIIVISFSLLIWSVCFFVTVKLYKKIINIYPINGVCKQLMSIWVYILIFLSVCFTASIITGNANLRINFLLIELILFAFGLLCIYIFTKFKFTLILALIYSFVGLLVMLSSKYNIYFSIVLVPFTFLIIGIYLKRKERTVA